MLRNITGKVLPVLGVAAVAELGISAYFYRRTMTRNNAKTDRTIKMAGTDWNQHMEFIGKRKEYEELRLEIEKLTKEYEKLKIQINIKKIRRIMHKYEYGTPIKFCVNETPINQLPRWPACQA